MTINRAQILIDMQAGKLPEQSVKAMLSRGLTHFFGSEAAAKITNWKEKFKTEHKRDATEDEIDAQRNIVNDAMFKQLVDGVVGTARGPKVDPLEAEMDKIAERKVWDTLAKIKDADGKALVAGNKKPKDEQVFTLAGTDYTFADLVERQLDKYGDEIKAEAEKNLAAAKRKREADAAKAEKAAADPTKALGL